MKRRTHRARRNPLPPRVEANVGRSLDLVTRSYNRLATMINEDRLSAREVGKSLEDLRRTITNLEDILWTNLGETT